MQTHFILNLLFPSPCKCVPQQTEIDVLPREVFDVADTTTVLHVIHARRPPIYWRDKRGVDMCKQMVGGYYGDK